MTIIQTVAATPANLFQLHLCFEFSRSKPCHRRTTSYMRSDHTRTPPVTSIGYLYTPALPIKTIDAFACTINEVTFASTFYFKCTKELYSTIRPVDLQRCLEWAHTITDETLGPHHHKSFGIATLINPRYTWFKVTRGVR